MLVTLGSIALGIVWGWLITGKFATTVSRPPPRPMWRAVLAAVASVAATAALSVEVWLFGGWAMQVLFLGASAIAAFVHIEWRRELGRRYGVGVHGD